MPQDVFTTVKNILVRELEISEDKVTLEARIQEDLGADSLDVMNITMRLEDEFDIKIPDEDITKIQTVQDVVNYIESKIKSA